VGGAPHQFAALTYAEPPPTGECDISNGAKPVTFLLGTDSVAGPSVTCGVTLPAHPSRSHSALGIRRLVCPNTNSWMGTHLIAGPAGVHNPTPVNSHGFPQDTS